MLTLIGGKLILHLHGQLVSYGHLVITDICNCGHAKAELGAKFAEDLATLIVVLTGYLQYGHQISAPDVSIKTGVDFEFIVYKDHFYPNTSYTVNRTF